MLGRVIRLLVLVGILGWLPQAGTRAVHAQTATPPPKMPYGKAAEAIVKGMSVNQKVGQLFIVSFPGNDVSASSDIAELITNYRVGGVQLKAANQNFANGPDGPSQIAQLANALQILASQSPTGLDAAPAITTSVSPTATPSNRQPTPAPTVTGTLAVPFTFIPLFVGLSQEGNGAPYSEITQGLTPLPSQLALGATWKPDNAEIVGQIAGGELSLVGANVLFGPVLDVLDAPKPGTPGDPATRVFGGDPYWVGQFGTAYIRGVQLGSDGRVAVVAKHFPGLGSSDRNVEDEIPTVQKSIDQLEQIELAPFFAVTQFDEEPVPGVADGLLVSHIRYRGFQGNIRASTRPVSLDPQAYQALMSLPVFADWRSAGGVTFSDALAVRGVRRFYDPRDLTFNARRVAQEAFIAGNDVLVLGDYGLSASWPEQLANIKDTIQFFRERYVSDPVFATRVDAALVRILALKLRLFDGVFDPATAQVNPDAAGEVLPANEAMSAIAKEAVTLLSPNERDLPAILAAAPGRDETVVFITDDRQIKECSECEPYPAIPPTALQDIALALYGPNTTGQLDPARVASFTFSDLAQFQDAPPVGLTATPTPTAEVAPEDDLTATAVLTAPVSPQSIQQAIEQANMVVFAMLDLNTAYTSTALFRDFLGQRGDLLREKRVVALAFGAPYYLDATEISKLTAYFGVYSRMPAFLEAAVRTLFGELPPTGSPPVSIPALNYSLISQTSPDPNQVIPLTAANVVSDTLATPGPLELKIGNSLQLRAGPILDRNGHSVPDGTPVQFVLAYPSERVEQQQPPVSTRGGAAETLVVIERKGQLEIRAIAEPATASYVIKVNIGDDASSIETIRPTAMPTLTPEPTAVPSATATPEATPTPQPPPAVTQSTGRSAPEGFLVTLLALLATGLAAVLLLSGFGYLRLTQRWRIVLWSWSAGWIVYLLYVSGAPGMDQLSPALGWWGSAVLSVGVAVAVLGIALLAVGRRRA